MVVLLLSLPALKTGEADAGRPTAKQQAPAKSSAGDAPKGPSAAKEALGTPDYLSPLVRELLRRRMARHGRDMLSLVQSVLFLDRLTVQRLASDIAAEPRLTRPIAGGEEDLNSALPETFFVLQDALKSRATQLAQTAKATDDVALATSLGELMQTCVSCHSAYLEPKPPQP